MTAQYKPTSIASIVIGIVCFIIILIFFAVLPDAVKMVGSPLLFLPSRLGLVESIDPADVQVVDLATAPTLVPLSHAGNYAIYTADPELLQLDISADRSWLTLTSQIGERKIPTEIVERGLRPYDTPLAKGRPVLRFTIDTPGLYSAPRLALGPPDTVSFVPDTTRGREGLLAFVMFLQIAIVVAPPAYFFGRRDFVRWRAHKASQKQRRREVDALWDKMAQQEKH